MLRPVGYLSRLRTAATAASYQAAIDNATRMEAAAAPFPHLASPWTVNNLSPVVWPDLFGTDTADWPLTRQSAISIPAVARQRHLICGTAARLPLTQYTGEVNDPSPIWAVRTDQDVSPFHRMLWTLDDHLFYGWSLWTAERDKAKNLLIADRVAFDRWEMDEVGRVKIDDVLAKRDEIILLPGPHEGILSFGASAIRRATANADAATNAARSPSAAIDLHYTGDEPLTPDEIDALIDRWVQARLNPSRAGVGFTTANLEAKELGTHEAHLLIEGRNADAVDMSRLVSSPASMADATNATASLTYETQSGNNAEFIDYGLALYISAIEARLSQDDIVAAGSRIAMDTTTLRGVNPTQTGPNRED